MGLNECQRGAFDRCRCPWIMNHLTKEVIIVHYPILCNQRVRTTTMSNLISETESNPVDLDSLVSILLAMRSSSSLALPSRFKSDQIQSSNTTGEDQKGLQNNHKTSSKDSTATTNKIQARKAIPIEILDAKTKLRVRRFNSLRKASDFLQVSRHHLKECMTHPMIIGRYIVQNAVSEYQDDFMPGVNGTGWLEKQSRIECTQPELRHRSGCARPVEVLNVFSHERVRLFSSIRQLCTALSITSTELKFHMDNGSSFKGMFFRYWGSDAVPNQVFCEELDEPLDPITFEVNTEKTECETQSCKSTKADLMAYNTKIAISHAVPKKRKRGLVGCSWGYNEDSCHKGDTSDQLHKRPRELAPDTVSLHGMSLRKNRKRVAFLEL